MQQYAGGSSSFVGAQRVDNAGPAISLAFASIQGNATSPTTWLGTHSISLAALNLEPTSVWHANYLDLQVKNPDYPNYVYYWGSIGIGDQLASGMLSQPFTITAGQTQINNHEYCLSEITLTLLNRSGLVEIGAPEATSSGSYGFPVPQADPFDSSRLASYVAYCTFWGTPAGYMPGNGRIRLALPAGDHQITPAVSYRLVADGTTGRTQFPPFSMNVGCQACYGVSITEDGRLGPIVNLANSPSCTSQAAFVLQGAIQASAGHDITQVTYSINGGAPVQLYSGGTSAYDLSSSPISLVPCGNTVIIEATDDGGLTGTATFTIKMDNTAPVLSGCQNRTIEIQPGAGGANVNFTVTATDNCDGNLVATCTPASGSFFLEGATTVTCHAVDKCGNTGACSFTVTVTGVDRVPPTISCPGPIVRANDAGKCSAVVTFTATASDNRSGVTYACVPPSGSAFHKGTTTVLCTARDAAGNTANCSFTVKVNDTEQPTAECVPTTNPAGGQIPTAGNNPKSGQNPDGFYQLVATDNCDAAASLRIYVKDSAQGPCGGAFVAGPYKPGDKVKLTQSPGQAQVKPMAGVIIAHINTRGEPVLVVTDSSGNTVCHKCFVPPLPK